MFSHIAEIQNKPEDEIWVDFGKVQAFKKYVKELVLTTATASNDKKVEGYEIKLIENKNSPFSLHIDEEKMTPGRKIRLKATYNPPVPFVIEVAIFKFSDTNSRKVKIVVRGETEGPRLTISCQDLSFFKTAESNKAKHTISITNISDISSDFTFDKDLKIFEVRPISGNIPGGKTAYITITFRPKSFGEYFQRIFCLIWFQEPIVINLFGLYTPKSVNVESIYIERYIACLEDRKGYTAYIQHCFKSNIKSSPILLSKTFLDFGRVDVKNTSRETIIMVNDTKGDVRVQWIEDNDVFTILPKRIDLPQGRAIPYEISFSPNKSCKYFYKCITAQIYWEASNLLENKVYAPLVSNIYLLGHSYPDDQTVISNIELDRSEIIFPTCEPGAAVYTQFRIENLAHLSAIFKMIPPRKSNISINPMLGLIKTYVIIVAMLNTKPDRNQEYFEEWYIEINGKEKKMLPLIFRGFTTIPSIVIGDNNLAQFGNVKVGIMAEKIFPVKNLTGFHLALNMFCSDLLQITPYVEVKPYDTTSIKISCQTRQNKNVFSATCIMRMLHNVDECVGQDYTQHFNVSIDYVHTELCATPSEFDFGRVACGSNLKTEFFLFNFGDAIIYFKLGCFNHCQKSDQFEIEPQIGELPPRSKLKVAVEGTVKSLYDNKIIVYSDCRIGKDSLEISEEIKSKQVFALTFYAEIFYIQIEEIIDHNLGFLFSELNLWTLLEIDKLNSLLEQIETKKTDVFRMNLPEFAQIDEEYFITLTVRNVTHFAQEVILKRKKLCNCAPENRNITLNSTKKLFNCPHRKLFQMELSDTKFYKNSLQKLVLRIRYDLIGTNVLAYTMDFGPNRIMEIHVSVVTIPSRIGKISSYVQNFKFNMKDTYIGLTTGIIQTFWLYNPSEVIVSYTAEVENLNLLCKMEGFEVLKFINPKGELKANCSTPLMIKFHPIEQKEYTVDIPINFDGKEQILTLIGKGVYKYLKPEVNSEAKSRHSYNSLVSISSKYLVFEQLTQCSKAERMISMKNIADVVVQYEWIDASLKYMVDVSIEPKEGIISPREIHVFKVKLNTYQDAILTDLTLFCVFTNYNEVYVYQKNMDALHNMEQKMEGYFTITENGTDLPNFLEVENQIPKIPPSLVLSLSVGINVISRKDADRLWSGSDLLSIPPSETLNTNLVDVVHKRRPETLDNIKDYPHLQEDVKYILTELLSNIVYSKRFKAVTCPQRPSNFSYKNVRLVTTRKIIENNVEKNAIITDISDEKKYQLRKFFARPKSKVLSEFLEKLLHDNLASMFKLGQQTLGAAKLRIDKELKKICEANQCTCKLHKPKGDK